MRSIDAEHRGTQATAVVQRNDEAVRIFILQAVHQVNLGADRPFAAGRRVGHALDDVLGGTDVVRQAEPLPSGIPDAKSPRCPDTARAPARHAREETADAPSNALSTERNGCREGAASVFPPSSSIRIPHRHFVQAEAQAVGRVSSEMLIGQEENLVGALQRPAHHRRSIRGSADRAAVSAAERFDGRRGVHVGDRNDAFARYALRSSQQVST